MHVDTKEGVITMINKKQVYKFSYVAQKYPQLGKLIFVTMLINPRVDLIKLMKELCSPPTITISPPQIQISAAIA